MTTAQVNTMGERIGVMADRITLTVQLMANATRACCPHRSADVLAAIATAPLHLPPLTVSTAMATTVMATATRTMSRSAEQPARPMRPGSSLPCIVDPLCWAAQTMGGMIDGMMGVMASMMTTCASDILAGTADIGSQAQVVLNFSGFIQLAAADIGKTADCIIAVERAGLALFQAFCPSARRAGRTQGGGLLRGAAGWRAPLSCPPVTPMHPPHDPPSRWQHLPVLPPPGGAVRALPPVHVFSRAASEINPFGDFKAMVDLCAKMVATANHVSKDMVGVMSSVAGGVGDMGGQVTAMVGKIGQMAAQVNVMIGRMATTAAMMEQLQKQCRVKGGSATNMSQTVSVI